MSLNAQGPERTGGKPHKTQVLQCEVQGGRRGGEPKTPKEGGAL